MHMFVLRGVWDAVLVAAPLVIAMLLTLATSVLGNFPLNFANIIALPLLIGLNNAYGAYLVMRRGGGHDVATLLETSTPRAVLFSGMTTIASFGTLAFSLHPGMAGMGILISLSLGYALLCALLVLPALMLGRTSCARVGA
jgi:predicted RND superfamily exporter protein